MDEDFENEGPSHDDISTSDHVNFYESGRHAFTVPKGSSDAKMWRLIEAHMKREKFFPNVWFISDHGNAHLMTKPKRERRQSAKTKSAHARAVAAAEKKYGTHGSWISGGFQSHWPERVKDKIRKLARAR